jgi:hypothetical protein
MEETPDVARSSTLTDEPSKKGCGEHPWFQWIPLINVSTSLLAYNTNRKKRSLSGSKSSSEAKVSFAHCLDMNLEQSSTVVGKNCEKRSATDGLTHRLLKCKLGTTQ